ncbi:GntR family transcriptional regulator [Microbacterium marinilacus]|uniref:GntR family transcriptional regulator n=1 Tax=Microbacterium marinilacus TaxID=415209 RepID=A0ABP7BYZ0_9MICO|nr:GntR family transcriptional regulator [Microbacterium marinilacus]MBY0688050.1 GntR family transcriptional regulator [Microbacterium marinilacus]
MKVWVDGTPPPRKKSLGEDAFHRIARAIARGQLRPGERLQDVELAERLHMSRTPVREALQRLERVGLVEILPSRLTRVTEVTPASQRMSRLHAGYQAGVAAHMAIPRLTLQERQEAAHLVEEMEAAIGAPHASEARRSLYSYLSSRSGNVLHHDHMSDMEATLERNLTGMRFPPELLEQMRVLHADLRDAILAGDAAGAERLIRAQHGIFDTQEAALAQDPSIEPAEGGSAA